MKPPHLILICCLASIAALPGACFADTKVVLNVQVQSPPSNASLRVPTAGVYTLSVHQNQVEIALPDNTIMIVDFDKKVVSTLDPSQKSFYQLSIDDFLSLGEKLQPTIASHYSTQTKVVFGPTSGQADKAIMGQPAAPYDLDLEALVARQTSSRSGGGGRGGGRHGGLGGGFPGTGGGSTPDSSSQTGGLASTGCNLIGEAWMAVDAPSDVDPGKLSIAEACVVMRGGPGLKGLADKFRKSKLMLVGANYTLSVLDSLGQPPTKAPQVSAEVSSIAPAVFDTSLFTIPGDYQKVAPPVYPLGTTN